MIAEESRNLPQAHPKLLSLRREAGCGLTNQAFDRMLTEGSVGGCSEKADNIFERFGLFFEENMPLPHKREISADQIELMVGREFPIQRFVSLCNSLVWATSKSEQLTQASVTERVFVKDNGIDASGQPILPVMCGKVLWYVEGGTFSSISSAMSRPLVVGRSWPPSTRATWGGARSCRPHR